MCRVRPIRRVRVWSRDPDRARAFARHARREDISIEAVPDAEQAVAGAAVICAVTAARTPVVRGAWLTPGAHINAVGASTPDARELDTDAVARARIFVDRREAALAEAGDLLIPIAEGALPADFAPVEIGDLLAGTGTGRTADTDITLFKSLGLAVEDAACAGFLFERGRHDPSIAGVAL
jgi:ornithine cyclodeaminase